MLLSSERQWKKRKNVFVRYHEKATVSFPELKHEHDFLHVNTIIIIIIIIIIIMDFCDLFSS